LTTQLVERIGSAPNIHPTVSLRLSITSFSPSGPYERQTARVLVGGKPVNGRCSVREDVLLQCGKHDVWYLCVGLLRESLIMARVSWGQASRASRNPLAVRQLRRLPLLRTTYHWQYRDISCGYALLTIDTPEPK